MKLFFAMSCCVGLMGCATDVDDSMYLTGTEEFAIRTVDGQYVCESPRKVLVCHIPPGNPDNAHTICVSSHAVAPHQERHADLLGVCAGDEDPPPPENPPENPPPDDPPPDSDPPPVT